MKKSIITLITFLCLLVAVCMPAYAESIGNTIDGVETAEDELTPDYEIFFKSIAKSMSTKAVPAVTNEDFDYSKAVKVYNDINIFEDNNTNLERIQEKLKTADYVYFLPIYRENKAYVYTLGKGLPFREELRDTGTFTDEDISYIESVEGRWDYTEVTVFDNEFDYIEDAKRMLEYNNIQNTRVYFVGGAGSGLTYIAVLCGENGDIHFNIISGIDENDNVISEQENRSYKLYTYDEMKVLAERGGEVQSDQLDGLVHHSESKNHFWSALFAAGAVLAVTAIAVSVTIAIKKKHKKADEISK